MEFNDGWRLKCKVQKQFPQFIKENIEIIVQLAACALYSHYHVYT